MEETLNWITFNLYGREGEGVPANSYITNAEWILDLPEGLDAVYEYQFYSPGSGSEPRSISSRVKTVFEAFLKPIKSAFHWTK